LSYGDEQYVLEKEQLYLIPPGQATSSSRDDPDNIPKFHDIKFEILDSQLADAVRQLGTRVRLKHYELVLRACLTICSRKATRKILFTIP
jgi:hypothetical protein